MINLNDISNLDTWLKDKDHLYIGRKNINGSLPASKWQNPFHTEDFGKDQCLQKYERYIRNSPELIQDIKEIENKQMGCFCKPYECHGDVLLKILREQSNQQAKSVKMPEITPAMQIKTASKSAWIPNQQQQVTRSSGAQRSLLVLMDSNRRHIDFHQLCQDAEIVVNRCGNTADARHLIEQNLGCPTDIILHVGINDLETLQPKSVAANIEGIALRASERFANCTIHVSLIPPRSDNLNQAVVETNALLRESINNNNCPDIKVINHKELSADHLHDKKHLSLRKKQGQTLSGTQLLAKDFYKSIYSSNPHKDILYSSRRLGIPSK